MNYVKISDATLCAKDKKLAFMQKLEIAKQMKELNVDSIVIPEIANAKEDILFVKTISQFYKDLSITVCAGSTIESVELADKALSEVENSIIRIALPVSPVSMEYVFHKKPDKMLEYIKTVVSKAKDTGNKVEFLAYDATRAEFSYIEKVINILSDLGADSIIISDTACELLPDDFAAYIEQIVKVSKIKVGVSCDDKNYLASANVIMALRKGATSVTTSVNGEETPFMQFATLLRNIGASYEIESQLQYTSLIKNIEKINNVMSSDNEIINSIETAKTYEDYIRLDINDSIENVIEAINLLGYQITPEDTKKVYEEFLATAKKHEIIGPKELDAIVANTAMQVPPTYKLISFVINSGNIISASAQVTLEKDGVQHTEIATGNGPINAAIVAMNKIFGEQYILDDAQIKSVNGGTDAIGQAIIKLRTANGLYSGSGISTDIVEAGIKAYINAVNKIIFEEG